MQGHTAPFPVGGDAFEKDCWFLSIRCQRGKQSSIIHWCVEMPDQSCPPASVSASASAAANQGSTATSGGDQPHSAHRREFLPPFQAMAPLDCTCEDEPGHCRGISSECREPAPCRDLPLAGQKCMLRD